MATAKNKLPTFGANASIDSSIVNGSSELANTGFQANTIIRSAQVNTYLKTLMNNVNGLIDAIYNEGAQQGEISATSSSDDVKNYITAGLSKIIAGTKVNSAAHADEATNVDRITNNDNGANANVKFSIGDQSFSKTVNNVAHATNAEKLDSNAGSATQPIYFSGGKPATITGSIDNDTTGNAATATKLETARTVTIDGAVTGSFTFDGSADTTATMAFNNVGGNKDGTPCYVDATNNRLLGISKLDGNILLAPDDRQHNKLSVLKLSNMYKNVGSSDSLFVSGAAQKLTNSLAADVNVGNSKTPVYFSGGVPVACNLLDSIYPVGSIYMSVSDNSPQTFLGGTWERIEGRFLLAAGSGYNAGSTGGEATHTLSTDEMPQHNHTLRVASSVQGTSTQYMAVVDNNPVIRKQTQSIANFGTDEGSVSNIRNVDAGKGTAHNNMPPYLAVYIWKRIA